MPIRIVKPTGNARRQMSVTDFSSLDKKTPLKRLTVGLKRSSGRNSAGQLVVRRKGCGAKRLYRIMDFSQATKLGQKAIVESIEYDPNRTAHIALLQYENNEKAYVLAPSTLEKGTEITCDEKTLVKIGNRMKMKNIPASTEIHNIELVSGKGGQLCRSAGVSATLLGIDGKYAQIRMPSGEVRKVLAENYATIGIVSNIDHSNIKIGKAGRSRHMGIRPHVRGKAMNPCDHPHGGGEGGTSIGMKYPKTKWGAPALGPRTRNKKKPGAALRLSRRKK